MTIPFFLSILNLLNKNLFYNKITNLIACQLWLLTLGMRRSPWVAAFLWGWGREVVPGSGSPHPAPRVVRVESVGEVSPPAPLVSPPLPQSPLCRPT